MTKNCICLLLSFCLLLGCSGTGWAATYQVTEDELTKLEQVFSELKSINAVLMSDSTKSQQDLIRALRLLKESQAELTKLQNLLITLQAESKQAKEDLRQASEELARVNQSFEAYAAEQKKAQARLKTERTLWQVVAAVAVGAVIIK